MFSFVARLLDERVALLAWSALPVTARGDGKLYAAESRLVMQPIAAGVPKWLSYHWPDVNLEWRVELPGAPPVTPGQPVTLPLPAHTPIIVLGSPPTDLPGVTVGTSVIRVPTAGTVA